MRLIMPARGIPYTVENGRITSHAEGSLMVNAPFRWIKAPEVGSFGVYQVAGQNGHVTTDTIKGIYDGWMAEGVLSVYHMRGEVEYLPGDWVSYDRERFCVQAIDPESGDLLLSYGGSYVTRARPDEVYPG